jgi:hypothetical protein
MSDPAEAAEAADAAAPDGRDRPTGSDDPADSADSGPSATATRIVLSYPEALSDWARGQVETDRYRSYFRRVLGTVRVGDLREEFVDVGCCGDSLDVPFRVERIETPDGPADAARVGGATAVDYETRPGDVEGGWQVQSAGGPDQESAGSG